MTMLVHPHANQKLLTPWPAFGRRAKPSAAKVAVSMDIDNTLIRWGAWSSDPDEVGLARTAKVLNDNRAQVVSILNTGRSLSAMQRIAPVLRDVPVDYMVLNNGQEIYINRDAERTDRWLAGLTPKDQDRRWRQSVRDVTGWDFKHVLLPRLRSFLADEGFTAVETPPSFTRHPVIQKPIRDGDRLMAVLVPDQSGIIFTTASGAFTEAHQAQADAMMATFKEDLEASGVHAESAGYYFSHRLSGEPDRRFYHAWLSPQGVSKASGLQRILRREPAVKAVITAGDHGYNDTEILTRKAFADRHHRPVPNYPILCGEDENGELARLLPQKIAAERIAYAEPGRIAPAIAQHLEALQRLDVTA